MPPEEVARFLTHLASLKPASLLLSGGEPLCHPLFSAHLDRAAQLGLPISLSTNGTKIDERTAALLAEKNVGYVGVSLDGTGETNDAFRGIDGAFAEAVRGIRNLKRCGCRVGLRFTMARPLLPHLREVMAFAEAERVDRICFYHYVPAGRARGATELLPGRDEMRRVLQTLFDWVEKGTNVPGEVLTVGNFADGILLYLSLRARGDAAAAGVLDLLRRAGGNRSGHGILSVRWDGALFADQFSWDRPLGTWADIGAQKTPVAGPASPSFGGRCGRCVWHELCGGNMRARARACGMGDEGEDPGCHLTEGEIVHADD